MFALLFEREMAGRTWRQYVCAITPGIYAGSGYRIRHDARPERAKVWRTAAGAERARVRHGLTNHVVVGVAR